MAISAAEGREIFGASPNEGSAGGSSGQPAGRSPTSTGGWSIVLAAANDPDPASLDALAAQTLERVRTTGGLTDAYSEKRAKGIVIAYGRYQSPDDPQARADLKKIRGIAVDGGFPFADAFLAPPSGEILRGANAEFDLRNARKNHGGKRAAYTLQVGAYARPDRKAPTAEDLKDFRQAAEKAAAELRRDGELAFYYHGPNSSSVTVGIFSAGDIDPKSPTGVPTALTDVRAKHPNHLLNGKGVNEKSGVGSDRKPVFRVQPTMIVAIPE